MTMTTRSEEFHTFPASILANQRGIKIIRYGNRDGGKKAYIQAGLHANEAPGFLVMHYLVDRLDAADSNNLINGEIVIVPLANPIGIDQWRDEKLQGRFDFFNGINFNRQFLDITDQIAESIKEKLTDSAEKNIALIRLTAATVLETMNQEDEAGYLKRLLLTLSHDADIVLDLHCDNHSIVHVYLGTSLWPGAADLSAQMGAEVTLLADDSGVTPFDEACSRIWWQLAKRFPGYPIPPACLAATIELRGMSDVTHDMASRDAANIYYFLQRRGLVAGDAPALPKLVNEATPLSGVDQVKSDLPGVVVFLKDVGEYVGKGESVAEVINPLAERSEDRLYPITSNTDGILFARNIDRYARPGRILAKIAGHRPLKEEGENLLTL